MKKNKKSTPDQVEKLLAQVELRQPDLDVEAILCKAAEANGNNSIKTRRTGSRANKKRCFCRWATLTGVWSSGLAVGLLVMYLYTSSTIQAARLDLKIARSQLAAQSPSQEEPDESSPEVLSAPKQTPAPSWQNNGQLRSHNFLAILSQPGPIHSHGLLSSRGYMSRCNPCAYRLPYHEPTNVLDDETSSEPEPYKPRQPKTQQQLFNEILKDLNV